MHVSDIMTTNVISVTVDTPVSMVADLIFDKNLTGMPVVDPERHVVGIVTEYDLLSRGEHIHRHCVSSGYCKVIQEIQIVT